MPTTLAPVSLQTSTLTTQSELAAVRLHDGQRIMTVWTDQLADGTHRIMGRAISLSTQQPIGDEFQISATGVDATGAKIDATHDGGFAVIWQQPGDQDRQSLQLRQYVPREAFSGYIAQAETTLNVHVLRNQYDIGIDGMVAMVVLRDQQANGSQRLLQMTTDLTSSDYVWTMRGLIGPVFPGGQGYDASTTPNQIDVGSGSHNVVWIVQASDHASLQIWTPSMPYPMQIYGLARSYNGNTQWIDTPQITSYLWQDSPEAPVSEALAITYQTFVNNPGEAGTGMVSLMVNTDLTQGVAQGFAWRSNLAAWETSGNRAFNLPAGTPASHFALMPYTFEPSFPAFSIATLGSTSASPTTGATLRSVRYDASGAEINSATIGYAGASFASPFASETGSLDQQPIFITQSADNAGDVVVMTPTDDGTGGSGSTAGILNIASHRNLTMLPYPMQSPILLDGSALLSMGSALSQGATELEITASIDLTSSLRLGLPHFGVVADYNYGLMTGFQGLALRGWSVGHTELSGTDTGQQTLKLVFDQPLQAADVLTLLNSVGLYRRNFDGSTEPLEVDISYTLRNTRIPSAPLTATQHLSIASGWSSMQPQDLQNLDRVHVLDAVQASAGTQLDVDAMAPFYVAPTAIDTISVVGLAGHQGGYAELSLQSGQGISVMNGVISFMSDRIGQLINSGDTTAPTLQIQLDAPPNGSLGNAQAVTALLRAITYRNTRAEPGGSDLLRLSFGRSDGSSQHYDLGLSFAAQTGAESLLDDASRPIDVIGVVPGANLADSTALAGPNIGQFASLYSYNGGVFLQRFQANGQALGAPIEVNPGSTSYWTTSSRVIGLQNGGTAIAWAESMYADTLVTRLKLQTFDPYGQAVGAPQLLYELADYQGQVTHLDLQPLTDGSFMLAANIGYRGVTASAAGMPDTTGPWSVMQHFGQDGQSLSQGWLSTGQPQAVAYDSVQLVPIDSTHIALIQRVITMQTVDGNLSEVVARQLQIYDLNGAPSGAPVALPEEMYKVQDVMSDGQGGILVMASQTTSSWNYGSTPPPFSVRLSLYHLDAAGNSLGEPVTVASWLCATPSNTTVFGEMARNSAGDLLISWNQMVSEHNGQSMIQLFNADLMPVGAPRTLNGQGRGIEEAMQPHVTALADGRFAVTWVIAQSNGALDGTTFPYSLQTMLYGPGSQEHGTTPAYINDLNNWSNLTGEQAAGQQIMLDADGQFQILNAEDWMLDGAELTVFDLASTRADEVRGDVGPDRIGLVHQGDASDQIGVDGPLIRYGGTVIATVMGEGATSYDGQQGRALQLRFNASADIPALRAVLRQLAVTPDANLPSPQRLLIGRLQDRQGLTWSALLTNLSTTWTLAVQAGDDATLAADQAFERVIRIADNEDLGEPGRQITIDWGDGSPPEVIDNHLGTSLRVQHAAFGIAGVRHVSIRVSDNSDQEVAQDALVLIIEDDSDGGTPGNDTLTGTTGADTLSGGDGNDTLAGGEGNDTLSGGNGDDLIDGGTGADIMAGGAGDDVYRVDDAGDIVTEAAGEGADTVESSITYTLPAQLENLTLLPSPAAAIATPAGAVGGAPAPASLSGSGNELANILRGTDADNWLDGAAGNDTLYGNGGADVLLGRDGGDLLYGGAGDDWLDGGAGHDFMQGGAGNDRYVVDSASDVIEEATDGGLDTVEANGDYVLYAGLENLVLTDTATNGSGNAGGNWIQGNAVGNWIGGGAGHDAIYGLGGNDSLHGDEGDDVIDGGDGNDELDGGSGTDTMSGGLGDDRYLIRDATDVILENPDEGTDTVVVYVDNYVPFANTENILLAGSVLSASGNAANNWMEGTAGDNFLGGGDGHDHLFGYAGNDTLYGDDGADTLEGGDGNDTLVGGFGVDTLMGGAGDDTYYVDGPGDIIIDDGGIDTVYSSGDYTLSGGAIENLVIIGAQDVSGNGDAGGNWMRGNAGANAMSGGAGFDFIDGDAGNDTLAGGADNDLLFGGSGDDNLAGNTGDDVMDGGVGADTYTFSAGDGSDVIIDHDSAALTYDRLIFGPGIDARELWMTREAQDLVILLTNTGATDVVRVSNWFASSDDRIELMVDALGWTITAAQVDSLVAALAASGQQAPTAGASGFVLNTAQQSALDTAVATNWA